MIVRVQQHSGALLDSTAAVVSFFPWLCLVRSRGFFFIRSEKDATTRATYSLYGVAYTDAISYQFMEAHSRASSPLRCTRYIPIPGTNPSRRTAVSVCDQFFFSWEIFFRPPATRSICVLRKKNKKNSWRSHDAERGGVLPTRTRYFVNWWKRTATPRTWRLLPPLPARGTRRRGKGDPTCWRSRTSVWELDCTGRRTELSRRLPGTLYNCLLLLLLL